MAAPEFDRFASSRTRLRRVLHSIASPYYRFRHAKLFHSMRVGFAMLASILLTSGIDIPHGIWASVTVLVVIGGLQHHGNIRKKSAERALGTLLGAGIGLFLVVQTNLIGLLPLTYLLMSVFAGVCAYFAIGSAGYVALLTAITMCIVAGHGDNTIDTGLWRTLNVLIGIVIALAFSFALPLYATYSWRYLLARNLRECARTYRRIVTGAPLDADEQIAIFAALGARLIQLRALMPSVAKEIGVPQQQLEAIQRLHRSLLSALEMMSTGALAHADAAERAQFARQCGVEASAVRTMLLAMARALRFGSGARLRVRADALSAIEAAGAAPAELRADLQGPYWLGQRLAEQVDQLRALLLETEPNWNIESAPRNPAA
jgi:uncharacterized membrane protein YccC